MGAHSNVFDLLFVSGQSRKKEEGNTDVTDVIVPHMLREGL